MTKTDFLNKLQTLLSEYPIEETSKSLDYYSEMIDDRIEDGMTEEEAVSSLGNVDEIATQIKSELPLKTIVRQKKKDKSVPTWVVVLLVLGIPLWFPLLISIASIVFSFLVAVWSIVFALWVVDFAFGICVIAGIFATIVMLMQGSILSALIYLGISLVLMSLFLFGFVGCLCLSKAMLALMGWLVKSFKRSLIR